MSAADLVLLIAGGYLAAGVLFGVGFVGFGVAKVDAAATSAGWGFRAMILPGVVLLWPMIATRLLATRKQEGETR